MAKTDLFAKMVSARSVAEDGYDAMMRGDLDVISGLSFSQRMMLRFAPFVPRHMIMDQVRKGQEVPA